jgi:PAS domain S-box-containing protein
MTKKPSYEELEKTVKELKKELLKKEGLEERLSLLSLAFEQSNEGIAISDLDGDLKFTNNAFTKMHGYPPEEFVGKNLSIFHTPEQMPSVETANLELKHTGRFKGEIWHVKYDGTIFPTLMYNSLIRDEENKPIGMMATLRDISDIKQAEEALRESEKRNRRLVETMNDGIGIQNENGLIIYVNNKFCQMLDYKEDDLIGKPVTNLLDDHNRQILKNQTSDRKKGKVKPYEIEWTCKDGRKIQTIMSPQAIFGDNGQFKGSFSVITDISILKQTEKLLRQSEERYRSLAENSRVGFWQTTLDGYTIYINPAMCQMLGIENSEELHGKTYHSFYNAENQQIVNRELAKREKGMSSTYEVELIGKNGKKRNVMISGAPIFLSENKIHSAIGTFTDVTNLKRTEEALMKAHDELEHRVKKRTRELEVKTNSLEEINTAMKVLLKKREEDKKEIEDNVLTNVKGLVEPYFKKIKKTKLDDKQEAFLGIIESNLNEIISPFTRIMSLKYLNLTPSEIQIANLIKYGSTTKKIAELLNISPRTVESHRKNIRRKIGLEHKRANLRSHLLSLH